jgi:hypothetical protein
MTLLLRYRTVLSDWTADFGRLPDVSGSFTAWLPRASGLDWQNNENACVFIIERGRPRGGREAYVLVCVDRA